MEKKKEIEQVPALVKIVPLKDHVIVQNKYHYDLKKGEEISVAAHFIPALKAEKVI